MGQILSNPIIDKEKQSGSDRLTGFGFCAIQGWRMTMEDAHINEQNVFHNDDSSIDHLALYGIFDGHGGDGVARYCGTKLVDIFRNQFCFNEYNCSKLKLSLIQTFLNTDIEIQNDTDLYNDHSGSTATVIVISEAHQNIICANAGDSRTVLAVDGWGKALSYDHKPSLLNETSRIVAANGFVEMDRVNGNLALSRAIGDFEFKSNSTLLPHEQIVTALPDILEHKINYDHDDFIILACDGIWDCLSSQECVDLVYYGINLGTMSLEDIASRIIDVCCSPTTEGTGIGCDNMSVTIVALLKQGETVDQWFTRVRGKKTESPTSFENRRKMVFSYYNFTDDETIFDVTTKPPEQNSQEHTKELSNKPEYSNPTRNPINLFSIESLLEAGLEISRAQQPQQFFHGSALADMLHSLSDAAAGETLPYDDTDNDADHHLDETDTKLEELE
ncbi:hypothetical protein KAFR_0L01640 [Kazachstania africana CBS 2517]|uniref:protein-serine/threonine phosphatase n=1 Tax=Kazachstania africana (strain ATCC 22294 / BCRC 22015 / CBS 2517 / CECT 1963 / NBRC 1671 / NRRL Y-8276) TaxID=1071382 RepID=H2B2C4_KAZAF|nr:hypothetical protein KAFR_0L01640 [Kazachstania africana CBS 2517]CCF60774.1 hypothetical protein KAFR_0L01640 [Kazachstania africana CBS 2517]